MTCRSLDFGRTVLDLVACGCSSNALLDRSSIRSYAKVNTKGSSRGYGARQIVFGGRDRTKCGVASMKAAETLLNGKTILFAFWLIEVGVLFFLILFIMYQWLKL